MENMDRKTTHSHSKKNKTLGKLGAKHSQYLKEP
jgi:hypothetical protein